MNYIKTIAANILKGQKKKYSQLIVKISIASITIGVAIMLLSMSIVTGFQHTIRDKVSGFGSHISITRFDMNQSYESNPILSDQLYIGQLKSNSNIKAVQPYATKAGIIKQKDIIEGIVLKGVDKNYSFDFFKKSMKSGTVLSFDSLSANSIMLSKSTADKLKIEVGDKVPMYFIQDPPRMRAFTVCGIYETGLGQFDSKYAIVNLAQIQKLNNWVKGEIDGIEILLNDFSKINETTDEISTLIPYDQKAQTIIETNPEIFDWIKLFDYNMYILIGLMIVISTITVISTLLILILEQTNTIGILKAIGASNKMISKIFTRVAGKIIFRGLLIGNIVALSLSLIQKYGKVFKLNQELYYMDAVPIDLSIMHYLLINVGVFFITTLFVILPIMIVTKKISTIKAIRYQ